MFKRHTFLLVFLSLIPCSLFLSGCGGRPETAASPDELEAFMQANPDIANEEPPEIEAE